MQTPSSNPVDPSLTSVNAINTLENEIDIRSLASLLYRQKLLITVVTGSCLLISAFYVSRIKPVWEGSFQIVLSGSNNVTKQQNKLLASLGIVNSATDRGNGISLETEVKILESPSVLKPVFDFVKESKIRSGEKLSNWRYANWKKNLNISLEQGTSVLNIAYQDKDKQQILPVLDRISSLYQSYAGINRARGISKTVAYLEDQLTKLKQQSDNSTRIAKTFAFTNRLVASSGASSFDQPRFAEKSQSDSLSSASDFAANSQDGGINLYGQLTSLDVLLEQKKYLLNSNDPLIQKLNRDRLALTKVIDRNLNIQASDEMIKFSQLVRNAKQDQATLASLELSLQSAQLEKARQEEPWQLISTPTVLDSPIGQNKKQIITLGLISGLFLGSFTAFWVDRRTGLLWSLQELQSFLPYDLLTQIPPEDEGLWEAPLTLLSQHILHDKSSIALLVVDFNSLKTAAGIAEALNHYANRDVVYAADNPLMASRAEGQIILVEIGKLRRDDVKRTYQQLQLQGKPVLGILLINNKNDMSI